AWDEVQREIQRRKFEATLKPRLDAEIESWHRSQPPMVEPPIRLGDLHIRAPWFDERETDSTD
ncbi:MAG: hypothetical protein EBT12_16710, partial [Marivivens sp.]|nr:hypothetical protein [Marivivens sp.]